MAINLFNPVYDGVYITLLLSYLLGIVHGITPDEHTWPITFSYAVGSGSTKRGAEVGAIFSAGFTLQRALMSEIIFFVFAFGLYAFKDFISSPLFFGIYIYSLKCQAAIKKHARRYIPCNELQSFSTYLFYLLYPSLKVISLI